MVATREPGGTPLGDRLRAVFVEPGLAVSPMAEAFVVSASRAQHVAEVIEPALARGAWVVCDRFAAATLAYQGYGRGVSLDVLRAMNDAATGGRYPDLTFLVDVPVAVSRERVRSRARASGGDIDRLEREDDSFHERVRAGYLELAKADRTYVGLDGTSDPAALAAIAIEAINARF